MRPIDINMAKAELRSQLSLQRQHTDKLQSQLREQEKANAQLQQEIYELQLQLKELRGDKIIGDRKIGHAEGKDKFWGALMRYVGINTDGYTVVPDGWSDTFPGCPRRVNVVVPQDTPIGTAVSASEDGTVRVRIDNNRRPGRVYTREEFESTRDDDMQLLRAHQTARSIIETVTTPVMGVDWHYDPVDNMVEQQASRWWPDNYLENLRNTQSRRERDFHDRTQTYFR